MKKVFSILLIIGVVFQVSAQDIHFSQFTFSPTQINPATAGAIEVGDYRLSTNYKSQWQSISNPFKTIFGSYDMVIKRDKTKGSYLAAGLSAFNDKAGKTNMGLTQFNGSVAYNVKLNDNSTLAGGVSGGYGQYGATFNQDIKWDDQYNGNNFDPSVSTAETIGGQSFSILDFGAGLYWTYLPSNKPVRANAGLSAMHVNRPRIKFYDPTTDKLKMKFILHGEAEFELKGPKTPTFLVPQLMIANQGTSYEVLLGTMFKYTIGVDSRYTDFLVSSSLELGGFYRVRDAIVFAMRYNHKKTYSFGISYDINVSKLRVASQTRGGVELAFAYKGLFKNDKLKLDDKGKGKSGSWKDKGKKM